MKKILGFVLLITCLSCVCCVEKAEASPTDMFEFNEYDEICMDKLVLSDKLSTPIVNKKLRLKYGEAKMRWYDSTAIEYRKLDSLEHEEMLISIKNEPNTR